MKLFLIDVETRCEDTLTGKIIFKFFKFVQKYKKDIINL